MFNNPLSLNFRTVLSVFIRNSIYFMLLSFFWGLLLPQMSKEGQAYVTTLLSEHAAPLTFNLLGCWSFFFIASYVAIFGAVRTPTRTLSWLGLYPAEATFIYGSISTGLIMGLAISGTLFWHEKSIAFFLFIGSLQMLLFLSLFAFLIRMLCSGIGRLSQVGNRLFAGSTVILTLLVAFYYYKPYF